MFYRDSFFFFLFSPCTLQARWTELNENWPHGRMWVRFENAYPKYAVSPPLQIGGPKNHLFRRLRNLTANLTAYIFGTKHDIDNRASALITTRVSCIASKCCELWSTNGFKLDRHFYPACVNSGFCFIARLRRRTPANGTQPNFAKRWTVNRANNLH